MSEGTVIVTGCAGFIGWKVSEMLLDKGYSVIGIDNMNDYYDPKLKEWRLTGLRRHSRFIFFNLDISDREGITSILSPESVKKFMDSYPEVIINLAARAGVRASVENPWVYLETNYLGTLNLLEVAKEFGIKRFVLASTSSIYGLNSIPFKEEDRTDHPLAPYSATKKAVEVLCYTYHYLYGIDVIIPRYFTVYGPAGRPDMSYFKFIKNIDRGIPIPVYGDGRQKRDFTYIDDIANGTIRCMTLKGYNIINLGNDNPVELMYVINLIEENLGKRASIEWFGMHSADVPATWADIESARKMLHWSPTVRIEEGIRNTVEWYKENRDFILTLRD
ncbi:MAG: NAD-dependent epimerase/dehydratase family protein [Thermodesulfovibrionales bacterium]